MPQFPQQWRSRQGVDREHQGKGGPDADAPATARAAGAGDTPAVIRFEPETVGCAIVFHMLDEGLAREVTGESVRRTVDRLRQRGPRPTIARGAWEGMTNHERLEWLLSETLTVPLMQPDEDVVTLETRDRR